MAARQARETEKAEKSEDERLKKQHILKSKDAQTPTPAWAIPNLDDANATADQHDDLYEDPSHPQTASKTVEHDSSDPTSPTSPTSPNSSKGFKSFLGKLKRRSKPPPAGNADSTTSNDKPRDKDDAGFVGGANLRSSTTSQSHSAEVTSHTPHASHDTALVHRPADLGDIESSFMPHGDRLSDVSSLSSDDETRGRSRAKRVLSDDTVMSSESDFEEARDHFDSDLAPPPTFAADINNARKGSPARDSKFVEVGI